MKVSLVGITKPTALDGVYSAADFIGYAARVSNPANQNNTKTASKLLKSLIRDGHWSPLEMVTVVMEIKTTRDIGRQILRHRSFSFQEFSQRYAEVTEPPILREARLQDLKNRQNSIVIDDPILQRQWNRHQKEVINRAEEAYEWAIKAGIAKEQARTVLPEGNTSTTFYMSGTLRSWVHYCDLRMANGTQKEHMDIAKECWEILRVHFKDIVEAVESLKREEREKENFIRYFKESYPKLVGDFELTCRKI